MNNNNPLPSSEHVCPSISGNLEAISQGIELCEQLNQNHYVHKAVPYVQSSIGEHLRHIIDLYLAVKNEQNVGVVDYDHRRVAQKSKLTYKPA